MNSFVINWLSPAYVRSCAVTTEECTKKGVFLPRRYFTIFAHRDILNSPIFNLSPIAGIQTSLAHPRIFGEKYAPCTERPSSEEVFPGGLRAAPHGSRNLSLQWLPVLHRRWRGDETPPTGDQAPCPKEVCGASFLAWDHLYRHMMVQSRNSLALPTSAYGFYSVRYYHKQSTLCSFVAFVAFFEKTK